MAFKDVFRRILNPPATQTSADDKPRSQDTATKWLEAMEAGLLMPPRDVHDAPAWDTYWREHMKVGPLEQAFSDMMSSDRTLVGLLRRRGARTVLCAGNGLSGEALSLAVHGFEVTALDLSRVPGDVMMKSLLNPQHPAQQIPGFRCAETSVVFEGSGPIPSELGPKIHRSDEHPPQRGGSLRFVAGDLMAPDVCPGPFDVVIERRTIQLFPEDEQSLALDRLAARLADKGTLVTHVHDGHGGPGNHRPHHADGWSEAHGFVGDYPVDEEVQRSATRLVCRRLSTG